MRKHLELCAFNDNKAAPVRNGVLLTRALRKIHLQKNLNGLNKSQLDESIREIFQSASEGNIVWAEKFIRALEPQSRYRGPRVMGH